MKPKAEWWTLYMYGSSEVVCSKHKSPEAAIRAASKCQRRGGAGHRVLEVVEAVPYKKLK